MLYRTPILVAGTLLIGLSAVEMRYYHLAVKPISTCRFQAGLCAEEIPIHLEEGRVNLGNLTSTDSSSISVQLTGSTITAVQ